MAAAFTMVDALRRAGAQPTRACAASGGHASQRAREPVPRQGRDGADGPERLLPGRAHADAALPRRQVAPGRRPRQRPLSDSLEIRTLTDGGQQRRRRREADPGLPGGGSASSTSRSTTSTSRPRPRSSSAVRSRPRQRAASRSGWPTTPTIRARSRCRRRRSRTSRISSLGVPTRPIAGIPDLMHHKYVVRDGEPRSGPGSTNWTDDSWTREENVIADRRLARARARLHARLRAALVDGNRRATAATSSRDPVRVDGIEVRPWFCARLRRRALAPDRKGDRPREASRAHLLAGDHRRAGARDARPGDRRRQGRRRGRRRPDADRGGASTSGASTGVASWKLPLLRR